LAVETRGIHERLPKVARTIHWMKPPWLTQAIAPPPDDARALKTDHASIARSYRASAFSAPGTASHQLRLDVGNG
jgi:hypothetical protein